MRSRYSAFVLHNREYLLQTWHRDTRPASVEFDLNQKWLGLKVLDARSAGVQTAEVEFVARYRIGGASAARLHERSRFILEGGRWFYVGGVFGGAKQ
jgi:SEC-C motif domain protein